LQDSKEFTAEARRKAGQRSGDLVIARDRVIRKNNTYHGGTETRRTAGKDRKTFYHRGHRGTLRKVGKHLTAKDRKAKSGDLVIARDRVIGKAKRHTTDEHG
jgi:hypothetical protein